MLIARDRLQSLTASIFQAAGSTPEEAATVAGDLVEANLKGHDSHGVGLIPDYLQDCRDGHLVPNTPPRFLRDDGPFAVVDARDAFGQVIGREVMRWAIDRVRTTGIAVAAVRDSHHLARIGAFGEMAAAAGLISIHFANVRLGPSYFVAPHNGSDGRLQTNPFCIAVPCGEGQPPLVLDFATSAIAMGKVRVARNAGKTLPAPVLLDARGRPTDDPNALYGTQDKGAGNADGQGAHGCLLPFGGHKGFGLSLMCEVLAGGLSGGGPNTGDDTPRRGIVNNMLSFVFDPARLGDVAAFQREVAACIAHVKASPPQPGEEVLVAGEPERRTMAQRLAEGIPIDDISWAGIVAAAATVGVRAEG